jgi:hypothetical protein
MSMGSQQTRCACLIGSSMLDAYEETEKTLVACRETQGKVS